MISELGLKRAEYFTNSKKTWFTGAESCIT